MKTPLDLLTEWLNAVNEKNIEKLTSLYCEGAILIPTFSNRILNTPEKIRKYFEVLGSRDELSIALHSKTVEIKQLGENLFSISGIYCWRMAVDEELLSFEARFSYIINPALEHPILHHHSSQIPRTI